MKRAAIAAPIVYEPAAIKAWAEQNMKGHDFLPGNSRRHRRGSGDPYYTDEPLPTRRRNRAPRAVRVLTH